MELTHAQAREMIQFDADSALSTDSLRILEAHLASCEACRHYADLIRAMEVHLRRAMSEHWNLRPAPLSMDAIKSKMVFKSNLFSQLATRLTVFGAVALMVFAAAMGIKKTSKDDGINQVPLAVPLIPTPSLQSTVTLTNTALTCEQIRYEVQPDDTLERIAQQFSISKNDLMAANNLTTEIVIIGSKMIIPLCALTPTGTVRPPAFTTTSTPLTESLSNTPDG